MNKKVKLVLPTIITIVMIATASAFACTYLMKEIKVKEFRIKTRGRVSAIDADYKMYYKPDGKQRELIQYAKRLNWYLDSSISGWERNEDYDYAVVVYDYLTQSTVVSDCRLELASKDRVTYIHLSDYLDKDEMLSLSEDFVKRIYKQRYKDFTVWLDDDDNPVAFLAGPNKKIVLDDSKTETHMESAYPFFPKQMFEQDEWIEKWTRWMNNDVLQEELAKAKERIKDVTYSEYETDSLIVIDQKLINIVSANSADPYANIIIIATYHPWKAAMRDLKGVYFLITGLTALISFLLSKNILDTYKKQSDLEETRRSFITAMAHDLKTPLAIVNGYVENILDSKDEKEKTDYFNGIIKKNNEINDMVSEMLDISKIDSSGFEIERKELVLNDVLKRVIDHYSQIAEDRSLSIDLKEENDFKLIGDEKLLEKLFSNLIDNAVSYGKEGTEIKVRINQDKTEIFNEADPIEEGKLKNIFEFKSGTNGHHGFGLYFAKKVADIHNLKLAINNQENGVNAVVSTGEHQTRYKRILFGINSA